jgi:hypothetical protein
MSLGLESRTGLFTHCMAPVLGQLAQWGLVKHLST